MTFDDNVLFISRLRMILTFNDDINDIENLSDFLVKCEDVLMKLLMVFTVQIFILQDYKQKEFESDENFSYENRFLFKYDRDKKRYIKFNQKVGIVYQCLKQKEMICYSSIHESPFYNQLIDVEVGGGIVTIPILHPGKDNKVLGIIQTAYTSKLEGTTLKPKPFDLTLYNNIERIISRFLLKQQQ